MAGGRVVMGAVQFLPGTGRGTMPQHGGGAAASAGPEGLPLHHAASRRGPPPRAGEELQESALSYTAALCHGARRMEAR